MGEYTNDLMMAIIVAATAFIGLTPVLFRQIAESRMEGLGKLFLLLPLAISIVLGASAVVFALGWLEVRGEWRVLWSQKLFTWEITICSLAAVIFFVYRCVKETRCGKPIARTIRSTRSRKSAVLR